MNQGTDEIYIKVQNRFSLQYCKHLCVLFVCLFVFLTNWILRISAGDGSWVVTIDEGHLCTEIIELNWLKDDMPENMLFNVLLDMPIDHIVAYLHSNLIFLPFLNQGLFS